MLGAIRGATKSWWVRGFLVLLASTFALFFGGGARMFGDGSTRAVAKIGGIEISQQQFEDEYRRQLSQFRGISPEQARSFGLPENTLGQMIGGALIDNAAEDLGLAISDPLLAAEIRRQFPGLPDNLIELSLRQQGLTVVQYQALVREGMVRTLIVDTAAPNPPAPRILAETIYRFREEQRIATVLKIPANFVSEIGQPGPNALNDYYTANVQGYTAPEYRTVAFVALAPEDVMDTVVVTEPEIFAEYEDRIREFTTIPNRGISELHFSLEATARAAQARMDGGALFEVADPRALRGDPFLTPLEEAAPAPDAEPEPVDTGPVGVVDRGEVTIDQLPAEVADAVFAMPLGTISQPLQAADGWHIFRIDSVEIGGTLTLEEARQTVTDDLMRERALEILYDLSIDLDDALGGGDTLEEAAIRFGLIPGSVIVDAQGLDENGNAVAGVPPFVNFVPTAFQTRQGGESLVNEAVEGGYFVLRIDGVAPPGPIPFDLVRGEVAMDWGLAEKARLTEEFAAGLFERAKLGTDMAALAAEAGIGISTTAPVTRAGGASSGISPQLVGELFGLNIGEVAQAPSFAGGFAIAKLVEIVPADPAANEDAIAALIGQFSSNMSEDLLTQYQGALEIQYGVDINRAVFEQATFAATSRGVPTAPTNNPAGF